MEINGIEITFREILASAVIMLVMLILGTDIDQTRELLMSGADGWVVIFWIVWIILTVAAVFGFCTLENDWLK